MVAHKFHHLRGELLALGRAVADASVVHQVAQTHDAQPNAARAVRGLGQLRHGRHVGVGVHHVIQEQCGKHHRLAQLIPIHAAIGGQVFGQVDRAQAAILVRAEELLSTRVCRLKLVQVRHRVLAVGGVQEQHARLAVVVRLVDNGVEQVARAHGLIHAHRHALRVGLVQCAVELAVLGRVHIGEAQIPIRVGFHGAHEGVGDAHRDVEIGDGVLVGLAGHKLCHVGVIHAQHGHVGPAPRSALGHLAKGVVIHAQEAHRPGGLPGGGFD